MESRFIFLLFLLLLISQEQYGQNAADSINQENKFSLNGFIRGGFYGDLHNNSPYPIISSAYADLGLKADYRPDNSFRGFADIRFRYGSEFHEPVNQVVLREAYVDYSFSRFNISVGQKIIKWGRADFTNPTSKLNPQNYISRTPDREDMDLGNIISSLSWFPSEKISFQAVAVPFYRSSILLIDPVPLPENVTIEQNKNLITDQKLFSYGLRSDFHGSGIDMGVSWFQGYDPMPGIKLSQFSADLSGPVPVISSSLKTTPYKINMAGIDFEASAGQFGLRGEAAWSVPELSYKDYEYVPLQEIKWVAGADFSSGNWRFTAEYSGKFIPGFEPSPVDPLIGTTPDYAMLAQLLATPGFNLEDYFRQQVAAFNRLYNYQLEQWYHQAGARIEADLLYGRLLPSVYTMYNITSRDFLLMPEIKIKPKDALTIVIGAEIWTGRQGSLFDLIENYMTSIYAGLKIDF